MQTQFDSRLDQAWWVLRIGLGLAAFLAGLDKFLNILANPTLADASPTFIRFMRSVVTAW